MIAETYSWRAVFFMIVPPGLIAMGFVWFSLAGNTAHTRARLDWTGFLALSIAMTGVQLMIDRGQRLDWFESPEIVAYAAIAGTAFWVFAVHSLTSPAPFLDPRLLLDRNFAIGLLIVFFMGMLAFTTLVLFPTLCMICGAIPMARSANCWRHAASATGSRSSSSCRSAGAFRG
jgi:MFS transporter, DHA2 family, multidrug resistance protein